MATAGRRSKLTPEVQKIILETLRIGATFEAAAGRAGVSVSAINEWRRRGHGGDRRKSSKAMAAFAIAVDRALAEAETSLVGIVRKAANTQWQAGAWLLERRWAGQYSVRAKLDVDATVTQRPPRQEMDELLAKIAAALRGDALPR